MTARNACRDLGADMDQTQRFLIVGAGPTGLTAAVELMRRGIPVKVIEKRAGASNLSRAVGILPASMHILEPSGVAAAIAKEAVAFADVIFHDREREAARISLDTGPGGPKLYGLAQDRTEAHLAEALERYGGEIIYGAALTGLTQTETHVEASISGQAERFGYVVGADGVASTVRDALGLSYEGIDLPGKWSIADVECRNWPDPTAFKGYLLDDGGIVIVAPLEPARFRVIANTPDALHALPVPMQAEKLRRAASFGISVRQVSSYQVGRVFLAGDAAHCHSPAGGRGMNLGIADAAELAERMATGRLAGYHDARHAVGAETLRFSERLRRIVTTESRLTRRATLTGLNLVGRVPPLRRMMVRRFLQTADLT